MVQYQPVNVGWKCPSCGANLSPSTVSCPFHNYKITTTPNTQLPNWVYTSASQDVNMFKIHPNTVGYVVETRQEYMCKPRVDFS